MRKLLKLAFVYLSITGICNAQIQTATDVAITAPPAPAGTSTPIINLSGSTSVQYFGEEEITLQDGFEVTADVNGTGYFLAKIVPPKSYAEMKDKLDGSYCSTIGGRLHFKYVEKYTSGVLNFKVYNYMREEIPMIIPGTPSGTPVVLSKKIGANFLSVDIVRISGFVGTNEQDSYYILEVTNDKGDKSFLRFKYLTEFNQ